MTYGTLHILDTIAASQQTIAQLGEDKVWDSVDKALAAHNAIANELVTTFAQQSTDRLRRYGAVSSMTMEEVDEDGRADAQKITAGANVGFPLRKFQISVQWTRDYLRRATGQEFAAQFTAATTADMRNFQKALRDALFGPTNYTILDRFVDNVSLDIKRLLNADSADIPLGPSGTVFDGATHTHYLARAGGSLAASDISAAITTVTEHFSTGQAVLYINRAQEAAVRAMTTNFTAYVDARIIPAQNTQQVRGNLDVMNIYDRAIGLFDSAEVWVKPWVPANYMFTYVQGEDPPLVYRTDPATASNLEIAVEDENYPLRARTLERYFGFGVWNRSNGAVLYGGNTVYAAPVFTA